MAQNVKKKLCWNCEGNVARNLETCPYCGVYLNPQGADNKEDKSDKNLIKPPYPIQNSKKASLKAGDIPKPPYVPEEKEEDEEEEEVLAAPQEPRANAFLYALLLILAGSQFALFGLMLYLFSDRGQLVLSWSQDYGIAFLALSVPLMGWGVKTFRDLK